MRIEHLSLIDFLHMAFYSITLTPNKSQDVIALTITIQSFHLPVIKLFVTPIWFADTITFIMLILSDHGSVKSCRKEKKLAESKTWSKLKVNCKSWEPWLLFFKQTQTMFFHIFDFQELRCGNQEVPTAERLKFHNVRYTTLISINSHAMRHKFLFNFVKQNIIPITNLNILKSKA